MIKAIIFDYGGVISTISTFRPIVEKVCEKFGNTHSVDTWYKYTSKEWKEAITGKLDVDVFYQRSADFFGEDFKYHKNYWENMIRSYDYEMLNIISELKKTYKIAILSNIFKGNIETFLEDTNSHDLFDVIVKSFETGVQKPAPKAYYIVSKKLGVDPKECVFVDDNGENCKAAKKLGMSVFHYKDKEKFLEFLKEMSLL